MIMVSRESWYFCACYYKYVRTLFDGQPAHACNRPSTYPRGGTTEQIEVKLLADTHAGQESLRSQFRDFDARHARCFAQEDTDRLLATLEGGFGTLGAFSTEVGAVLESVVSGGADVAGESGARGHRGEGGRVRGATAAGGG